MIGWRRLVASQILLPAIMVLLVCVALMHDLAAASSSREVDISPLFRSSLDESVRGLDEDRPTPAPDKIGFGSDKSTQAQCPLSNDNAAHRNIQIAQISTMVGSYTCTGSYTCAGSTCFGTCPYYTCYSSTCSGTCSGATCSGTTCSGSTCSGTCSGTTCSGDTCSGSATCGGGTECTSDLALGEPVSGFVAESGWTYYKLDVSSPYVRVKIDVYGMTGDVDLYVKNGSHPTLGSYDGNSTNGGVNDDSVTLCNWESGTFYIGVYGYDGGEFTIEATLDLSGCAYDLTPGEPVSGSVSQSGWTYYKVDVSNSDSIKVEVYGGDNVHVYVKNGSYPTHSSYDAKSTNDEYTDETITLCDLESGTLYIGVYGFDLYDGGDFMIKATLDASVCAASDLTPGEPVSGSVYEWEWKYYKIGVSSSVTQIGVEVFGMTGNVDLYVKKGSYPTFGNYDGDSVQIGTTDEMVTVANSGSGTLYIGVYGYEDGEFTIKATLSGSDVGSIQVTSPNGGETWQAGSSYSIGWSYTGDCGTDVKIELLKSGVVMTTISSSTTIGDGGTGSYSWPISSSVVTGADYSIRISGNTESSCADASDSSFAITGRGKPNTIPIAVFQLLLSDQ